ncbi:hypothetical protein CARUB_v10018500mg [Capsella rubella]|uniref:Uncharacterized protein n=1 Tax=Capsella rubella TaxID=81985 RepID=R0H7B5_9BRAS|nr:hypothetical protein CARUB_v10018500mg [Capsella rubella]
MKRNHHFDFNHPFNPCPFEVFCLGTWKAVEYLRIKNGTMMNASLGEQTSKDVTLDEETTEPVHSLPSIYFTFTKNKYFYIQVKKLIV